MKIESVFFVSPVRVPGSRSSMRLAQAADGFQIERINDGVLVSRSDSKQASWVPDANIECAFIAATTKEKSKS